MDLGNAEADTASCREDDWYTADSNSQASAAAEEFQHASFGELRLSNFGFPITLNLFSLTDWILRSELSHLVLIPLHENCCSRQPPCCTWIFEPQRFSFGCVYCTAGRDKVYAQGKRIPCTLDGTGKPMVIESRKVNCRRPLMAVTEMTDCGRWVCLGPQRQGFSSVLIREKGKR